MIGQIKRSPSMAMIFFDSWWIGSQSLRDDQLNSFRRPIYGWQRALIEIFPTGWWASSTHLTIPQRWPFCSSFLRTNGRRYGRLHGWRTIFWI